MMSDLVGYPAQGVDTGGSQNTCVGYIPLAWPDARPWFSITSQSPSEIRQTPAAP